MAELDGEVVGMMALSREKGAGWIDQLYLHPRAVGLGVGAQFVARPKSSWVRQSGCTRFRKMRGRGGFTSATGSAPSSLAMGAEIEEHCPDVLYEWSLQANLPALRSMAI